MFFVAGDCLIAFKSTMVFLIGYYLILILKLSIGWPRPFWVDPEITTDRCNITFSMPNCKVFDQIFFWNYQIYFVLWKYNRKPNKIILGAAFFLNLVWTIFNTWVLAFNGVNYLYVSVMSAIFAIIYLFVAIYFDDEIMRFCEKLGFIQKSSRYYKFYTLFASMILFIAVTILCSGIRDTWLEHTDWLINSVDDLLNDSCRRHLTGSKHDVRFLGNIETFDLSSMLFYIIGMVFGTTFSMAERVDALDWIRSSWKQRFARLILALLFSFSTYMLFNDKFFTVNSQVKSQYVFYQLLPKLIISFVIYGPFVVLCQNLGLVKGFELDKKFLPLVIILVGVSSYEFIWLLLH